jgi:hypothetical protein
MVSLQEGLRLSAQLGDKAAKPRILNSLGWLYGALYNLETALRYNQEVAEAAGFTIPCPGPSRRRA